MKENTQQYTLRNIPDQVDKALRRRAKEMGLSFNQVAIEALAAGAGEHLKPKRDFSEIIGSLSESEATQMEEEIRLQRQVDPELWKS